jgi:ABC-type oligopeptide transport system ATPase subunit
MEVKDFFVSYTATDRNWAEWISWELEHAGYRVILQAWDFRPSMNFVSAMDRAARESKRTLAVLSQDYLRSEFCTPEWAAALAEDPKGERGRLVPVRIQPCDLSGLLGQVIYIDLVGLDEASARAELLQGVNVGRVRPSSQPRFPGSATTQPNFPGSAKPCLAVGDSGDSLPEKVHVVTPDANVVMIHLSDMHFEASSNIVASRVSEIAAAFRATEPTSKHCVIVISGDIAYSGQAAEYTAAKQFLRHLEREIKSHQPDVVVSWIIVPGNHDCNFKDESKLRAFVLQNVGQLVEQPIPDTELVRACLSVQAAFWDFESEFVADRPHSPTERLYHAMTLDIGNVRVRCECFNSAWLSRPHEKFGELYFPTPVVPAQPPGGTKDDLVVSVLHHPYSWFADNNRRELQALIERRSDVVLTGHEHSGEARSALAGEALHHFSGAVLQEVGSRASGFSIVVLDPVAETHKQYQHKWQKDHYPLSQEVGPVPSIRNHIRAAHDFDPSEKLQRVLDDPGRGFAHPHRKDLRLSDIYVYPDLWKRSFRSQLAASRGMPTTVRSAEVLSFMANTPRILVTGESECGKTSLAKTLCRDLAAKHGLVPVMLSGEDIKAPTKASLEEAIQRAFRRQYEAADWERYEELEATRRLIVIDNFQRFPFNARGQREVLAAAEAFFGRVVALADDLFRFEELTDRGASNPFLAYEHCEIQQFGYLLRRHLIRRWLVLGREYTLDEKVLDREILERERVVNTLTDKKLLPAFPVNILIILQTVQAGQSHALVGGAYGYYYEALITPALASSGTSASDTDTRYTFLARFAHFLFTSDLVDVKEDDMHSFTNTYLRSIRLELEPDELLAELIKVQILERRGDVIGFRYRYYYFYFVARHLKGLALIGTERVAVTTTLRNLVDFIYYEPYANILIFYLYFNRDTDLIEYMLEKADFVFHEYSACDLEDHVEFFNSLNQDAPARRLPAGDQRENQERFLEDMDRAETASEAATYESKPERIAYADHLHPAYKLNIAMRTLQVLGQVLRNFPGSIEGDLKTRIVSSCYRLGLRSLQCALEAVQKSYPGLREYLERLLSDRRYLDKQSGALEPLPRNAERFTLWLAEACSLGVVLRISQAVGHEQLGPTYRDVLQNVPDQASYALIDVSIKLDYFRGGEPPIKAVRDLAHRFRRNPVASGVLCDLVYHHLCIHWHSYDIRQALAAPVRIKLPSPILSGETKLLGKKPGKKRAARASKG